jgi:hypothetical protein
VGIAKIAMIAMIAKIEKQGCQRATPIISSRAQWNLSRGITYNSPILCALSALCGEILLFK